MAFGLRKKTENLEVQSFYMKVYPELETETLHIDVDVFMRPQLSKITITQDIIASDK